MRFRTIKAIIGPFGIEKKSCGVKEEK